MELYHHPGCYLLTDLPKIRVDVMRSHWQGHIYDEDLLAMYKSGVVFFDLNGAPIPNKFTIVAPGSLDAEFDAGFYAELEGDYSQLSVEMHNSYIWLMQNGNRLKLESESLWEEVITDMQSQNNKSITEAVKRNKNAQHAKSCDSQENKEAHEFKTKNHVNAVVLIPKEIRALSHEEVTRYLIKAEYGDIAVAFTLKSLFKKITQATIGMTLFFVRGGKGSRSKSQYERYAREALQEANKMGYRILE